MPVSDHPTSIYDAIMPLYVVLNALGLAPYTSTFNTKLTTLQRKRRSDLSLTSRQVVYSLAAGFLVAVVGAVSTYFRITVRYLIPTKTWMVSADVLSRLAEHAICLAAILQQIRHRHTVLDMFDNVQLLDKILKSDMTGFYKATKTHLKYISVTVILGTLFMSCFDFYLRMLVNSLENAYKLMTLNLVELIRNMSFLQFHCWIYVLLQRFEFINKELASLGQTTEPQPVLQWSHINNLRRVHFGIFKLARTLNGVFGLQLMITILSLFLKVLTQAYMVVAFVRLQAEGSVHGKVALLKAVWAVSNTLVLALLAAMCASIKSEHNKTQFLVQKILLRRAHLEELAGDEVGRFARQVANTDSSFTACELFDIDKALVLTAAANVTTYLVVLLQIQE